MLLIGERTLDSDMPIEHLRGYRPYAVYIARYELGELRGCISAVTIAELFSVRRTKRLSERQRAEKFLSLFTVVPVSISIAIFAGELHRDYGLSLPDAIIAATALNLDIVLVNSNIRHFQRIPNLRLEVTCA